jgi:predicted GNAT superfamily acetyltransferase
MNLRELRTIDDFRRVCALEQEVWGYTSIEDAVPVPIMIVTQKIGGLLVGAFDETDRLVGFAYSVPGILDGKPFQWSHMLGVAASHRGRGLGWRLKLEQRRLTLAMGLNLIEWTFDPLQALNAHFNLVRLGAVAREYHLDVYGESSSVLHRGTPTDRLIAQWWLQSPRVVQRLEAAGAPAPDLEPWPMANAVSAHGEWIAPRGVDLFLDAPRLGVTIPTGFTEMQLRDGGLARDWRASTREIFSAYLSKGYEVIDFALQREQRRGVYLLGKREA